MGNASEGYRCVDRRGYVAAVDQSHSLGIGVARRQRIEHSAPADGRGRAQDEAVTARRHDRCREPQLRVSLARARDPVDLHRAGNEALLAANVVEGEQDEALLAYDDTGTYQLLLPHMSDPVELRRFYDETVSKIVAYDEQYETSDLVGTLETFL